MDRAKLSVVVAGFLAFVLPCEVQASTLYEQGLQQYKLGQFRKAAQVFSQASLQEPSKQLYHYLLANCLVRIDQHQQAADEYKLAYMLDSSNSTGEFCRKALLAYKKKLPADSGNWRALSVTDDDNSELGRVKKLIQRQASFEKDKHETMANRSQQAIKMQIDEQLRAIDLQMHADIQKLHDPILYNPGPQVNRLLALPELLKEREDQIRAVAQAEKERIIQDANARTKPYESWRKDRSALLDEAADNLQTQLDSPVGRSGVKLQTHGTDLYVRYYGKEAANKYPDAHGATARIQDANSPKAADPASEPSSEVKGKVIKDPYLVNTLAGK